MCRYCEQKRVHIGCTDTEIGDPGANVYIAAPPGGGLELQVSVYDQYDKVATASIPLEYCPYCGRRIVGLSPLSVEHLLPKVETLNESTINLNNRCAEITAYMEEFGLELSRQNKQIEDIRDLIRNMPST